jgi:hypothetical protein
MNICWESGVETSDTRSITAAESDTRSITAKEKRYPEYQSGRKSDTRSIKTAEK